MLIHLDTDIGGDPDDVCALAMLLGWPGIELAGITTVLDRGGVRAGYLVHCLRLAGATGNPLAAGAAASLTTGLVADPYIDDARYWPLDLAPVPSPPGAAVDLLQHSIERGATIIAIGPVTNLALLELIRPGSLRHTHVVMMGGWTKLPAPGYPQWGPEMDWNVQWDTRAAQIVVEAARVTLVPLNVTLAAQLRSADLERLRSTGSLGDLIARQSLAHAEDAGLMTLGQSHAALPNDLLNFHYDPVACATAVGDPSVTVANQRLRPVLDGEILRFESHPDGRDLRVAQLVDAEMFAERWLSAVAAAQVTV
ncbi:MAG: nucleoside hydrolase [Thermomicrobiales bacterium]|nr:nucleoside hydrolase [Thermomicrobiales bacterium]